MTWLRWLCVGAVLLFLGGAAQAATPRVLKVLPQYLDKDGKHTLSPSLYERDAYQAMLRRNPAKCSGIRFAVQWKAHGTSLEGLTMRVEMRTSKKHDAKPFVKEVPVGRKGIFSHWTYVAIDGEAFQEMGEVAAWRVSLMQNGQKVAEQRSFLW